MSLDAALTIASSQIHNITSQISLVSQNIANANTPDYASESISQTSLSASGVGMGAANGPVQLAVDQQGQADLLTQNAQAASLQTQQTALQQIDAVEGAVGSGTDLGSLLGTLSNGFSALAGSPDNQTQQQQVVASAQTLTTQINTIGNTVQSVRQSAQNAIVSDVGTLNSTLATLGSLSDQIVQAQLGGQNTANLENQRAAAEDSLSQLVSVKFLNQPNGDLLVTTGNGLNLPIHGPANPLSTSPATLGPTSYAPGGGIPAITLNGQDVTAQLTGGQIGGNIALRDTTLPTIQANLDEFSETLTSRFAAQGLTLFSNAGGNVPAPTGTPAQAGYIGYASQIQVNPAVLANPALVTNGTTAIAGSPTGASAFTPNPTGGPAGFTGMITRVLQYALGSNAAPGVAQPPPNVGGLGPTGTLSAGYATPPDLAGLATAVTAQEAQTSANATSQLNSAQAVRMTLQSAFSANTSVSVDTQMSHMMVLQNAYGANAHVMAAVQAMWTQLLQSFQ